MEIKVDIHPTAVEAIEETIKELGSKAPLSTYLKIILESATQWIEDLRGTALLKRYRLHPFDAMQIVDEDNKAHCVLSLTMVDCSKEHDYTRILIASKDHVKIRGPLADKYFTERVILETQMEYGPS